MDSPLNIRGIKRFAVDNAGEVPVPPRAPETGKKIAVIGGGPSGLTAAYFLSLMASSISASVILVESLPISCPIACS